MKARRFEDGKDEAPRFYPKHLKQVQITVSQLASSPTCYNMSTASFWRNKKYLQSIWPYCVQNVTFFSLFYYLYITVV